MSIKNKILSVVFSSAVLSTAFSILSFAEDAAPTDNKNNSGGGGFSSWIPIIVYLVIIGLLFYFLLIRPQKKRQKQEQELRDSIILGDELTTIGGIVGKVVNIKDDNITIESSIDKTLIEFKNWAIRDVKKPVTADPAPVEKKEEVAEEKKK